MPVIHPLSHSQVVGWVLALLLGMLILLAVLVRVAGGWGVFA